MEISKDAAQSGRGGKMNIEKLQIKLTLTEPMLGTIPKSKEVYEQYIIGKLRADLETGKITQDEFDKRKVSELETVKETEEKGWTGFHSDESGIFVYDYMIRGFLKNAATVLRSQMELKNQRSKIDSFVFVFPRKIHILSEGGKPINKPDGVIERPLRAQTMQGPRVTLARSDYVNAGAKLVCEIHVVDNPDITIKKVQELLDYGQLQGLGQFRNGSYGRFTWQKQK